MASLDDTISFCIKTNWRNWAREGVKGRKRGRERLKAGTSELKRVKSAHSLGERKRLYFSVSKLYLGKIFPLGIHSKYEYTHTPEPTHFCYQLLDSTKNCLNNLFEWNRKMQNCTSVHCEVFRSLASGKLQHWITFQQLICCLHTTIGIKQFSIFYCVFMGFTYLNWKDNYIFAWLWVSVSFSFFFYLNFWKLNDYSVCNSLKKCACFAFCTAATFNRSSSTTNFSFAIRLSSSGFISFGCALPLCLLLCVERSFRLYKCECNVHSHTFIRL